MEGQISITHGWGVSQSEITVFSLNYLDLLNDSIMSGLLNRILFPGIVPALQSKVLSLPLPEKVKTVLAHPAGPFTIHFYAPTFKWTISIANLSDINRPTHLMSVPQQLAVSATGLIWSRYSYIITPRNYNLLSVNFAMALTGLYQISRIARDKFLTPQKK